MEKIHLIKEHYERNWHSTGVIVPTDDIKMKVLNEYFCVLEFAPNDKRGYWIYATVGMSLMETPKIELHIFSKSRDHSLALLLTIIAHYHFSSSDNLNLWHTVNFGMPWYIGSECTFGFISLPYLEGPELEVFKDNNDITSFYWLIPITESERDFKKLNGVEALEDLFEKNNFNYLDPFRKSLV
jgi:Suppressor of fused protein (SUFU)